MFATFSPRISKLPILVSLLTLPLFVFSQSECPSQTHRPVLVPIRNVTVADGVIRRGAALSLGTQPQELAFEVLGHTNNTFIYDNTGMCDPDITQIQCTGQHGGLFNESKSSSWSQADSQDAAGASREHPYVDATNAIWSDDILQLSPGISVKPFPFAISRTKAWNMNSLGLGRNSTLLNALYSAGAIASRSWSLFWGLHGADAWSQMDGTLVLGGYDSSKVTGDNFTDHLTIDKGCITSFLVTVTDIVMNLPDGSHVSIIGPSSGSALKACIIPDFPLITIPQNVWSGFSNHSGGTYLGRTLGIGGYGMLYAAENVYAGSLTFSIASGLKITIPNSQLVVPDRSINSQGMTVFNDTTREIMLNSLQGINANDIPILGQTFLTSAYLSVNQDAGTFTLWQSQATHNQSLVGIGPNSTCTTTSTSSAGSGTSSNSATTTTISNNPLPSAPVLGPPRPASFSPGAIAGTCIGVAAACAFVAFGLATCFRRRDQARRRRKESNPQSSVFEGQELPSDSYPLQELPWRYTMKQHEAPGHMHSSELPAS